MNENETSTKRGIAGITTDDQRNATERRARGEFVRGASSARSWIEDLPDTPYAPEAGRYHLYVAYNCPWCHRVMLGRAIVGLEDVVSVDVCYPNRSEDGESLGPNLWKFAPKGQMGWNGRIAKFKECTEDTVCGKRYVKEVYELAGMSDQKSVPILFDKKTKTIVNNESAEILRMFGTVMARFGTRCQEFSLYPDDATIDIDEMNDLVYKNIANGAYKAGFSSNQDIYEMAYENFYETLDYIEKDVLSKSDFLIGDNVTEADIRLFPPLYRLDPVYYNRFKLNKKYLWQYSNIWKWMGRMMNLPGMEPVTNTEYLAHCKQGYFGRSGNGVIPLGPPGYPEAFRSPHKDWQD